MKVILLNILFCVVASVTAATSPLFKNSFFDDAIVEDIITDLAGRQRLIVRDLETDQLQVFWVLHDRETLFPYVLDPRTNLPYLLQYKKQEDQPTLYRMIRGKDHRFVVTDPGVYNLYRPVFNGLGEIDLTLITEEEAGFSRNEVKLL